MNILVLNCGSSSVKFKVIRMPEETVLLKGTAEKTGDNQLKFQVKTADGFKEKNELPVFDYPSVFELIFKSAGRYLSEYLKSGERIDAVGHRLVHGGEGVSAGVKITTGLLEKMREMVSLAPLHYPANLAGIEAVLKKMPEVFQAGIFDTGFHQTIPPEAFHYAIPMKYYRQYGIRRYGFHGTSHHYVALTACEFLEMDFNRCRIISCHLGNGASVCAIRDGKSTDTSMGFTPLEGLIMGTRSGDLDPGVLLFLMKNEKLTPEEMDVVLNRQSGMLGLSEYSSDIRELLEQAELGNEKAILSIHSYVYRIKKYIGAYSAVLGGLDLLIFTGGTGENSSVIRKKVCEDLGFLGIQLDEESNQQPGGKKRRISSGNSQVPVMVVPSDEELMIARESMRLFRSEKTSV